MLESYLKVALNFSINASENRSKMEFDVSTKA